MTQEPGAEVPLRQNRSFRILWTSQILSEFSGEILATIAPLLVIFGGGTETEVGLTMGATATALMIMALPAGVIADRVDLRSVMVAAQLCRLIAVASLLVALIMGEFHLMHLVVVMFLEGVLTALFAPAEHSALSRAVAKGQLRSAIAVNVGRPFIAALLAPMLAGYAFEVDQWLPAGFFVLMIAFSVLGLIRLRLPERVEADGADAPVQSPARALREGLSWALRRGGIRGALAWMLVANLMLHTLIILAVLGVTGVGGSGGDVGLIMAGIGLGGVVGGLTAQFIVQRVAARWLLLGLGAGLAAAAFGVSGVLGNPVWVAGYLALGAVLAPVANAIIISFVLETAPEDMRGRASSAASFLGNGSSALGPVLGGAAAGAWGVEPVLLGLALASGVLALCGLGLRAAGRQGES
ncbi:MAG: MFS transporter [Brevibacterium aurantiacum]